MEAKDIMVLIGNGLFPIVACFFLYKVLTVTMKENTNALNALSDTIADLKGTMQHITTYIIDLKERKDD